MTREQLGHAIRAACDAARETELRVFGSRSLLGSYPDAPAVCRSRPRCCRGWQGRTRAVRNANTRQMTGHCLDPHDLAASKLAAHRPKDLEFVRTLLAARLIKSGSLITRINLLPVSDTRREQLRVWVDGTAKDLRRSESR